MGPVVNEILIIIIMTCKLSLSNIDSQYKEEAKCQQKLTTCMREDIIWTSSKLVSCIERR